MIYTKGMTKAATLAFLTATVEFQTDNDKATWTFVFQNEDALKPDKKAIENFISSIRVTISRIRLRAQEQKKNISAFKMYVENVEPNHDGTYSITLRRGHSSQTQIQDTLIKSIEQMMKVN